MCRQGALRNIIQSHQDLFRSGEVYPGTPLDGVSYVSCKNPMKKMMFLGVAQLIWETSRYGQPPLLTMPQMSSVQKPLTIPVYSHSLPPKFPPCFRGLGFGCASVRILSWFCICISVSAELPRMDWEYVLPRDLPRHFRDWVSASAKVL